MAAVEKKYHILKEEAVKFQDMENKISTISEKVIIQIDIAIKLGIYYCLKAAIASAIYSHKEKFVEQLNIQI